MSKGLDLNKCCLTDMDWKSGYQIHLLDWTASTTAIAKNNNKLY